MAVTTAHPNRHGCGWWRSAARAAAVGVLAVASIATASILASIATAILYKVLAADTVGWIDGEPMGKPADDADARRILRALSGREHELWTGVVLWRRPDDVQVVWQEVSRVAFAPLSDEELERYLRTREWQNNSGAYAILEEGDPYVRVVEGSVTNVIGLPLESLTTRLEWLCGGWFSG